MFDSKAHEPATMPGGPHDFPRPEKQPIFRTELLTEPVVRKTELEVGSGLQSPSSDLIVQGRLGTHCPFGASFSLPVEYLVVRV